VGEGPARRQEGVGVGADRVRAAGGVVVGPPRADGEQHVLLVSRAKYGDWSLPKGKCIPGEDDRACALREIEEETGLRGELGPEVGTTEYIDGHGRPKVVRWFLMRALPSQEAAPGNEVAAVRWATVPEALELLTWERDAELLRSAAARF
jgi:8-oxo-dGTP pyrophosphatase MutT (NUDIX family)